MNQQGGLAVCIGNFDGVHRGHVALLQQSMALPGVESVTALTFDPHPRAFFGAPATDRAGFLLTSPPQRLVHLRAATRTEPLVVPFCAGLAEKTPAEFVRDHLLPLRPRVVCVGENFRFGRNRTGDVQTLRQLGDASGFRVHVAALMLAQDMADAPVLSSSRARDCVRAGDLAAAAEILGRPFAVRGVIEEGDRLGRQLGFPTANLPIHDYVTPRFGVYAVVGEAIGGSDTNLGDSSVVRGVMNIGVRPTVAGVPTLRCETFFFPHLTLDAQLARGGDSLYGQEWEIRLLNFVRPEQRFDSIDALRAQIARDVEVVQSQYGTL
ncbi:MAG: riboflavin biosynthesis protein RibF [Actinomycetia bacterium]|nr:riboflavin biosynthesis protein RibF [Actinomycetes bacterium]